MHLLGHEMRKSSDVFDHWHGDDERYVPGRAWGDTSRHGQRSIGVGGVQGRLCLSELVTIAEFFFLRSDSDRILDVVLLR